ncbi:MAG: aspartate aminotransferase family protein [Pseudomonadota bacterium]
MNDIVERRERLFGKGAALFYREPLHIVRGDGVMLYDASGREYLDMYNNVPCVGHANPHVVEAMSRQAGLLNVHSRYLHEGILDYAERLLAHHPDNIESLVFACSGTEANEVAIMMARFATGGRGIICTDAAYHGNSTEVRKLSRTRGLEAKGSEVRSIPFPQRYRPLAEGLDDAALTALYLERLEAVIRGFEADGIPLAAMLVCPILANEGLPDVPDGFMAKAAEMVHAAGGLMIADEVQAGMCRTGTWWGYDVNRFVPDIVTMGKPLGNGMPLSAAAASRDLVEKFRSETRYFNTFASSPLQAAAGNAVLDIIEGERLWENVSETGNYLLTRIRSTTQGCQQAGDVRGCGLFAAVEWVTDRTSKTPDMEGAVTLANHLKDRGVLLGNAGALGNVIKIRPPLVFTKTHADRFLVAWEDSLRAMDVT